MSARTAGRVGPYRPTQSMGKGAFGEVIAGQSVRDGEVRAVKLHPGTGRSLARFQREYVLLDRLAHPAVPVAHELGTLREGGAWFAMSLASGLSANRYAARAGPVGSSARLEKVASLLVDLLDALVAVHAHVVHCDLKSSNLRLGPDGRLTILDFGGATVVGAQNQMGTVYTRGSAALEQLVHGPIDDRTDLYAVGVLAYRLLTGIRPLPAEGNAVAHLVESTPVAPSRVVSGIPEPLSRWVQWMMSVSPVDRPLHASVAVEALREQGFEGVGWPEVRAENPAVEGQSDPALSRARALLRRGSLSAAERVLWCEGRSLSAERIVETALVEHWLGRTRVALARLGPLMDTAASVDAACVIARIAERRRCPVPGLEALARAEAQGCTPLQAGRVLAWRARLLQLAGDSDAAARSARSALVRLDPREPAIYEEMSAGIERGLSRARPMRRWSRSPQGTMARFDRLCSRLQRELERDGRSAAVLLSDARRLALWIEAGLTPDDRAAWALQRTLRGLW